ncbi:MAG: alpha/beta hydrolase [Oscillospiraceae bacterium]|nr:alpha/beta hydrolase [Oscillospiraceae bacterium]
MFFSTAGERHNPVVILLHGAGLSDWSWQQAVQGLKEEYYVVTPVIDGHAQAGSTTFISIQNYAQQLIKYIDTEHQGKVFAMGGLSLGAQIVTEVLSQRADITRYAILESALVYPIKSVVALTVPSYKLCYGLINRRWFSKMQAKSLCVPSAMFEQYYQDSLQISRDSLINITLSNGTYALQDAICATKAKVLVIVGEKELGIMKKSARLLHQKIPNSRLFVAVKQKHGEWSLRHTSEYIQQIKAFWQENEK